MSTIDQNVDTLPLFVSHLDSNDQAIREAAAMAIGAFPAELALDPVLRFVDTQPSFAKLITAIGVLCDLNTNNAFLVLERLAQHPNALVSARALRAIAKAPVGVERRLAHLVPPSKDSLIWNSQVEGLGMVGGPKASQALIEVWNTVFNDPATIRGGTSTLAEAMAAVGDLQTCTALQEATRRNHEFSELLNALSRVCVFHLVMSTVEKTDAALELPDAPTGTYAYYWVRALIKAFDHHPKHRLVLARALNGTAAWPGIGQSSRLALRDIGAWSGDPLLLDAVRSDCATKTRSQCGPRAIEALAAHKTRSHCQLLLKLADAPELSRRKAAWNTLIHWTQTGAAKDVFLAPAGRAATLARWRSQHCKVANQTSAPPHHHR